ncbi:MAG: HAD family hydrolase [Paludibacteraceae bacterium]|nr:HAD family hydrolase [Paludibacteraceae bacterium]
MYKGIFIDIDDTLLDYIPCCREAFDAALRELKIKNYEFKIQNEDELFELFFQISGRLFSEAKHGLHTVSEVMELYPREFVERMSELTNERVSELEIAQRTDTFKHAFRAAWGTTHTLVPEAKKMLESLQAKGYRLFAASNSFGHLQRSRLEHAGILRYFEDTFISMDIGYDKPDIRFYQEALRRCGLQPSEVLMIGDSMTTDVLGAQAAGIDALYFDRQKDSLLEIVKPLID